MFFFLSSSSSWSSCALPPSGFRVAGLRFFVILLKPVMPGTPETFVPRIPGCCAGACGVLPATDNSPNVPAEALLRNPDCLQLLLQLLLPLLLLPLLMPTSAGKAGTEAVRLLLPCCPFLPRLPSQESAPPLPFQALRGEASMTKSLFLGWSCAKSRAKSSGKHMSCEEVVLCPCAESLWSPM